MRRMSALNHNIYRGLYPIREVKQYYRREFVNGKPLYICLWTDCGFKTWKYSQHIARHIHLKHIGIKELKCEEPNCEKTFKRPESLVQHQKNHLCGFGIDSLKMKDPNNVCGVKNIKKFYFRELDNDYYVFGCKWNGCEFVTNNSGSIRRHVHNQHLCPHTSNNNGSSNGHSNDNNQKMVLESLDTSYVAESPMVQVIELDPQLLEPQLYEMNDNQMEMSADAGNAMEEQEMEANANRKSSTGGLYSLKHYSDLYRKVKINGEVYFKCNCNRFTTKNQISLVRHIWTDIGRNEFDCDINGCNAKFDNENSLYKHKRNDHNLYESNKGYEQNGSFNEMVTGMLEHNNSGLKTNEETINIPQTLISLLNGNSKANNSNLNESQSAQTSTGIYSLKNLSQYFTKSLVNNEVFFECKCGQFRTKSNVSLVRHIWSHKGVDSFECDLCTAQFEDEASLYRHRRFDHNSITNQNSPILPIKSNSDFNYANNSNFVEESISSSESNREDSNSDQNSKHSGFKRSFGSDRNNSGLYSLKNYEKFYVKVKINEEISYKCTVCGFSSRSQVSLIRHIWTHTGMNSFACDVPDCSERFNTETELYKHRKSHSLQSSQTFMTSTPNYSTLDSKPNIIEFDNTGAIDMQMSIRSTPTGSHIRKIMESKAERGIYSLKNYENQYKKIKLEDGFQFICNCGQLQTRSQATLVRHFWEHQNSHGLIENSNKNSIELKYSNQTPNNSANNQTIKSMNSDNAEDELYDEDIEEDMEEEAVDTNFETVSQISKMFASDNTANKEMPNESSAQNTNELSTEDKNWNRLIVEIEDRGYFCQWPDCEFSDECRESVVSHIKQMHNNGENDTFMQTSVEYDNEIEGNYDSDSTSNQSFSQMAANSTKQLESLIGEESRDDQLIYLCKASNCMFETALNSAIISHIQQNHMSDESLFGNSNSEIDYSNTSQTNPNQFLCNFNYCNTSFPSLESLIEHKKIHSNDMTANYDNSDDNIEDEMQQNFSMNNIKPIKSWKTYSYNGKMSALNADQYSDSITQTDGSCLHICKWNNCGYQSPVRGNIIRHIRRHTGDKPFICQLNGCGRGFAYSTEVKLHQQKDH